MTAEFTYTTPGLSIGGGMTRLFRLDVGDTAFYMHAVDNYGWRHQPRQHIVV